VSALVLVPLSSLLTTAYGRFLIAKAVIVAVAAGLAVAGRMWLNRKAAPGAGPALVTRLEICALAVVLVITGILTVLTPPAKPSRGGSVAPTPAALHRPAPVSAPGSG
jgi:copper transport protein